MQKNTASSLGLLVLLATVTTALSVAESRALASGPVVINTPSHLDRMIAGSGMTDRHRTLARRVLGMLPHSCQEKLETFTVLYNNPKHRGLAGRGVIIVSGNVPDTEFVGLLMHEGLGHFHDITCVTGTGRSGTSAFRDGDTPVWNDDPSVAFYNISWVNTHKRRTNARPEDFVTGYAYAGDAFEDLAETATFFASQEKLLRLRAEQSSVLARKLAWMERNMPHIRNVADGGPTDGDIPWDATKLAFTWTDN